MAKTDWSSPVSNSDAYRRAGGRRAHNFLRQVMATYRRTRLVKIAVELEFKRGWQSEAANRLEVNRSTISRDVKELNRLRREYRAKKSLGLLPKPRVSPITPIEDAELDAMIAKLKEEHLAAKSALADEGKCAQQAHPEMVAVGSELQQKRFELPHYFPRPESRFSRMRCFHRSRR